MLNLDDRIWKPFFIGNVFAVKRPKARSERDYKDGKSPFVASGNFNNGVIRCCEPHTDEILDKGNCITVSPVDGSAFYQQSDFLGRGGAGSSILLLYSEHINKYSGLFIARLIRQTCSKYCYGKMGNKDGIKREKILLPITDDGQPDYKYMEQYTREQKDKLKKRYIDFIDNNYPIQLLPSREEKAWANFKVVDLFDCKRGNQNNMNALADGNDMLISAKNINNGLKGFYTSTNDKKGTYKGNCITLNNDGDGGVGLAYYQPYRFLLDTHVYALYPKENISYFVMLYLSQSLSKQRVCFSHGYSISRERLNAMKIMLPITDDGKPDYKYMEQYAKAVMLGKYKKYLEYARG